MELRDATATDVEAIAALAQVVRERHRAYQPQFWRLAPGARRAHQPCVARLVADAGVVSLVAVDGGRLLGYGFATIGPAPPVYDPGGPTAMVDDFAVADDEAWAAVGLALGRALAERAVERGAAQLVMVCAHLDDAKRSAVARLGLSLASEWYVGPLTAPAPPGRDAGPT